MNKTREREREYNFPATTSRHTNNDLALLVLIIIGVVVFGLVAVKLFLEFQYSAELLSQPCDLCLKLNPRLDVCFDEALTVTTEVETGKIINNKLTIGNLNLTGLG